jgi:hypothetical protein
MARVTRNGRTRRVKKRDWLLRHAAEVVSISIADDTGGSALLVARLLDGGCYMCTFEDAAIARAWVSRPCLAGVPLTIIDARGEATHTVCTPEEG